MTRQVLDFSTVSSNNSSKEVSELKKRRRWPSFQLVGCDEDEQDEDHNNSKTTSHRVAKKLTNFSHRWDSKSWPPPPRGPGPEGAPPWGGAPPGRGGGPPHPPPGGVPPLPPGGGPGGRGTSPLKTPGKVVSGADITSLIFEKNSKKWNSCHFCHPSKKVQKSGFFRKSAKTQKVRKFALFLPPPENRVFFTFLCTSQNELFVIVINVALSDLNDHVYTTTFDTFWSANDDKIVSKIDRRETKLE